MGDVADPALRRTRLHRGQAEEPDLKTRHREMRKLKGQNHRTDFHQGGRAEGRRLQLGGGKADVSFLIKNGINVCVCLFLCVCVTLNRADSCVPPGNRGILHSMARLCSFSSALWSGLLSS